MKTRAASPAAFSLMEVSITLAIVAFALIGILGMMPIAIEHSRDCVDQTRAAQMARMVFSTLDSEPFTAAPCFSAKTDTPLDLSTRGLDDGDVAGLVVLYAAYSARDEVKIVRSITRPVDTEYQLELRFEPARIDGTAPTQVRGTLVRLKIRPERQRNSVVFEGAEFLSRLKQGATPR